MKEEIIRKDIIHDYTTAEAFCPKCGGIAKYLSETKKRVYGLKETHTILYSNFQCKNGECKAFFSTNKKELPDRQMYTDELIEFVKDLKWEKRYAYRRICEILLDTYKVDVSRGTLYNWCETCNPLKKAKVDALKAKEERIKNRDK